jgi:hypothetical protein
VTASPSRSTFAASAPREAVFIVYINGLEVPAKSVSMRSGVWIVPEMQVEMVADPVLIRLGNQDRVQVTVFYLDDCAVDPSVPPAFRLFGEGEITGWGYRNTSGGRSIVFTVVNQIAIFSQLFVQFMTTLDDMIGYDAPISSTTGFANPTSQLVFPFALFQQGLLPAQGQANALIKRPFDFLYNAVRGMMDSIVPNNQRTVPAANFFTRWARLTNFHNRFVGCPSFDAVDNAGIFPVLQAVQSTTAVDAVCKNLIQNVQNSGSIWDMLQLVFQTMLMEVAMIPAMPLISVSLATGLALPTDFASHKLVPSDVFASGPGISAPGNAPAQAAQATGALGQWVPAIADSVRAQQPLRMQNYFPKPQMLFSIPPSCNVVFSSQLKTIAYEENYATQPTRLYFNDDVLNQILKIPASGLAQSIENALAIGYPPAADHVLGAAKNHPLFHAKNFLIYPEEFFKGPVMDRQTTPRWLFFLKQNDNKKVTKPADAPGSPPVNAPPPARTGTAPAPPAPTNVPINCMNCTNSRVGVVQPDGSRKFDPAVEALRNDPAFRAAIAQFNLPADFALAWIQQESGGSIKSLTYLNERGYFQITGPHVDPASGNFVSLAHTEAGAIGLTVADTGASGPTLIGPRTISADPFPGARLSNDKALSLSAGCKLVRYYRGIADGFASRPGISVNWTEGDMWRLTKAMHDGAGFWGGTDTFKGFIPMAAQALGRPPASWAEMYNAISSSLSVGLLSILNNATGVGGIVATASGSMLTQGNSVPFTAPSATPAPPAPSQASSSTSPPQAPPTPVVDAQTQAAVDTFTEDVYHLYAKYEFFRERYARRSGSATIAWNPYAVPGFPGVIFDERATRVDLMVYVTAVQQYMSNAGSRTTTLSFLYGRQLQEMFDELAVEFSQDDATARGSGPQEPIRAVSSVLQSFPQAEAFYQQLFFGNQQLFGKPASFDFRSIIGLAPVVPGAAPEPIFIDGPDAATQDANVAAAQTIATLLARQVEASAQVASLQSQLKEAQALVTSSGQLTTAAVLSPIVQAQLAVATQDSVDLQVQLAGAQAQLTSLNVQIEAAAKTLQAAPGTPGVSRVQHNLADAATRPLVPLPSAQALFDSRQAAEIYNWRPICTLDEYIIFYDVAGIGAIPPFGHPHSVGARYFDRIRRFTPPAPNFSPPIGADGTVSTAVPGLDETFPQTAADWDSALIAYKNNVLTLQAPRT